MTVFIVVIVTVATTATSTCVKSVRRNTDGFTFRRFVTLFTTDCASDS
jgi:hypothetical protein